MVIGKRLSYWEGNFSGAMSNFGRVNFSTNGQVPRSSWLRNSYGCSSVLYEILCIMQPATEAMLKWTCWIAREYSPLKNPPNHSKIICSTVSLDNISWRDSLHLRNGGWKLEDSWDDKFRMERCKMVIYLWSEKMGENGENVDCGMPIFWELTHWTPCQECTERLCSKSARNCFLEK